MVLEVEVEDTSSDDRSSTLVSTDVCLVNVFFFHIRRTFGENVQKHDWRVLRRNGEPTQDIMNF